MRPLRQVSAVDQLAAHLREELLHGPSSGELPGMHTLAAELGSNHRTVAAAVQRLEREGLLVPQGVGRPRLIRRPRGGTARRRLQVAILNYDPLPLVSSYFVELLHLLLAAGHRAFFTSRSLTELRMEAPRVARLVAATEAEAWVVGAASREVLQWFIAEKIPAFALFGRREGLPIAGIGPNHPPAIAAATLRLIGLGHRRIAKLVRRERREPEPGTSERAFLGELRAAGIPTGAFNLPDWEETVEGFHAGLDRLFATTPPTALLIDEAPFVVAAQQFLTRRNLRVPEQVSLICTDFDPAFAWCRPMVAHFQWKAQPVVRRVVRWVANVANGRPDTRQTLTPSTFFEGGTIGPAPAVAGK